MKSQVNEKKIVVITDLDGTLLDQQTYSFALSLPAMQRLRKRRIPIVLCSTKTRAEMLPLWRELELRDPFICESGGSIHIPPGYFQFSAIEMKRDGPFDVLELGSDILFLRERLAQAARSCGVVFRSFASMSLDEINELTGLPKDQAFRAWQREYDEPFVIESGNAAQLIAVLQAQGLTVTKGDRFYHLTGGHGKGEAVKKLLDFYRRQWGEVVAVGLGNSANDLPLLRETDIAVLVRNPDGRWDAEVTAHLPSVKRTHGIGPDGWREAIDNLLNRESA
ncbi:MAG: HAD-IIB family hydrolase [Deltaproteobacteria bacterium]|nr:HAD-IIB family hydrolase [Deltaproteobacteria bacterium]